MEPITIYRLGLFGTVTLYGKAYSAEIDFLEPSHKTIRFIPSGKRKPIAITRVGSLIVRGTLPEAPSGFETMPDGSQHSRYTCFDERYTSEYRAFCDQMRENHKGNVID